MRSSDVRGARRGRARRGASTIEYAILLGVASIAVIGGGIMLQKGMQAGLGSASLTTPGSETGGGQGSSVGEDAGSAGGGSLFQDNFSGKGDTKKWSFQGGTWGEEDGSLLVGYPRPGGEERAYAAGVQGGDFAIKTKATLFRGDGYGIIFRATDDLKTGYTFQYEPNYEGGQFTMRKWVNGYEIWPPIASVRPSKGFAWDGVEHEVEIDAQGAVFTAKVDGKTVMQAKDSSYSSGGVGLRAWNSTQAAFDSFSVKRLKK